MRPDAFLSTHPLFTRAEFADALRQRGGRSPDTVTSHLVRWQSQKRVEQVKRGVYVRTDGRGGERQTAADYLALAARMAPDAALAYHTALEALGYAQSFFERLTFVTWTKAVRLQYRGREFVPVRPSAKLDRAGKRNAWVETVERSGLPVRVTSLERTVVDCLSRPDLAGGMEEVWRSLSNVLALDLKSLESYACLLESRIVAAKVGLFLEQRSDELAVPTALLERLRARAPRAPAYVDRREKGRLVSGWNLIVPSSLLLASEGETE